MKRTIFMVFTCMAVCLFAGCGKLKTTEHEEKQSTGITVTGSGGTIYESYQEACTATDFQAAHQFLNKLKSSGSSELTAATEYVFKQEALYLMSLGDETAKKRIIYLLKEEGDNNEHVAMLIDLAIEDNDTAFVKQLANQYTQGTKDESVTKTIEFLMARPSEDAQNFVLSLLKKLGKERLILDFAIKTDNTALIKELAPKYASLDDIDLLDKLAEKRSKDCSDVIISILSTQPSIGRPLAPGHYSYDKCHIYNDPSVDKYNTEYDEEHKKYCEWLPKYNHQCDKILDLAINKGNAYLAQKVLPLFKQNIETCVAGPDGDTAGDGTKVSRYSSYIRYYNADKDAARKKYQEAVRSGAFN